LREGGGEKGQTTPPARVRVKNTKFAQQIIDSINVTNRQ